MEGKGKNILMLLSNPYLPDSRVYIEAKALIEKGYSITLIAWDRDGKFLEKETRDDIDIIRVGPRVEGKKHFIRNIRHFWRNAKKVAESLQFDAIHAHDFDTLPLGVKLKKSKNVPLVFDAHEIYSQMIQADVPGPVSHLVQLYENRCLKKADRIITVIEGHVDFYKKRAGDKVSLIMNIKPHKKLQEAEKEKISEELGLHGQLSFILIGSLGEKKFIEELIKASKTLKGVKIIIGGFGQYSNIVAEEAKRNSNMLYLGHVHPDMVLPYTSVADMVFSVYYPRQPMAVATKFFDAVSAGTPILVNENGDKTTEMVKKHNCGLAIPYDLNAFIQLAEELKRNPERIKEMKQNIIALQKEYAWETMAQRLLSVYDGLLKV